MIPFHIQIIAKFIATHKSDHNEAKGEIVRLNFKDATEFPFKQQVSGNKDGYVWLWVHIGQNYWKVVGKYEESYFSCM